MLHLINSLAQGGAESFLKDVVRPNDIVITLFDHPAVIDLDCRVEKLDLIRKPLRSFKRIRELFNSEGELLCWLYIPMFLSLFACSSNKIFWTVRTSDLNRHSSWHSWVLAVTLAPFSWVVPQKIIYCSQQSLRWHSAVLLWCKGTVVLNGPRNIPSAINRTKSAESNGNLKMGVIGRLSPQKGQRWLLNKLSQRLPCLINTEWYFYGRNVSSLESAVNNSAVSKMVLSEPLDAYKIFENVDIVISVSLYGEGYPNVVAEAINFGKYVIASDSGAVREMGLREEQIFKCGDEVGLWACLERYRSLSQSQIETIESKAQRYIRKTQSRERQVRIFREVLNG